ncbi:MAG TPA: hypothetical protein VEY51_16315, partial [Chondromyces sp.]|nr:hypothetical protein [Chondromyces sp.]
AYDAQVYQLVIASPSDLIKERTVVREAIYEWNSEHSKNKKVIFQPVMWEYDTVPEFGIRPQESINNQIIHESDIMVAMFGAKLGSPTGKFVSGTIEEINEFQRANKPIALYFSNKRVPTLTIDIEQLDALKEFKKSIRDEAIYHTFKTNNELKNKVSRYLTVTAQKLLGNQREQSPKNHLEIHTKENNDFAKMLNDAQRSNADGYWLSIVANYNKGLENFESNQQMYVSHWAEDLFHTIIEYDGCRRVFGSDYANISFPEDQNVIPTFRVRYSNNGVVMVQWRADSSFVPLDWLISLCLVSLVQIINSPVVTDAVLTRLGIVLSNSPEQGISTNSVFTSSASNRYLKSLNSSWETSVDGSIDVDWVIKEFVRHTLSDWGYYNFEEGLNIAIIKMVKQEFLMRQKGISFLV